MEKRDNSSPINDNTGNFTVEIKNFGKIADAKLQFNGLTLLAGINNTGKSYVSRALYSIFSAISIQNPLEVYYVKSLREIADNLSHSARLHRYRLVGEDGRPRKAHEPGTLGDVLEPYTLLIDTWSQDVIKTIKGIDSYATENPSFKAMHEYATKAIKDLHKGEKKLQEGIKNQGDLGLLFHNMLSEVNSAFKLLEEVANKKLADAVNAGYKISIEDNLIYNFQVAPLSALIGRDKKHSASIKISFGKGSKANGVSLSINPEGIIDDLAVRIENPQAFSDSIYLESPIYWKIKDPLMKVRNSFSYRSSRHLDEVHGYVYKAITAVNMKKSPRKNNDPMLKLISKIHNIISGKIIQDDRSKELLFVEKDKDGNALPPLSLLLTATGISQLGMIAYLIENQTINRDSTLFIDEPEAHLHPNWQEQIMAVLYELANYGIRVIIATHSPIVMQKLELLLDDSVIPQNAALNSFDESGTFDSIAKTTTEIRDEIAISLNDAPYKMLYRQSKLLNPASKLNLLPN